MFGFKKKAKKPKIVTKRFKITPEIMEKYSKVVSTPVETSLYFDKFIKGCLPEYEKFFERNPENRAGRFYARAYLYLLGGRYAFVKGEECTTLYEAYIKARTMAFNIDKKTWGTGYADYPVEWEINMLIDVEK